MFVSSRGRCRKNFADIPGKPRGNAGPTFSPRADSVVGPGGVSRRGRGRAGSGWRDRGSGRRVGCRIRWPPGVVVWLGGDAVSLAFAGSRVGLNRASPTVVLCLPPSLTSFSQGTG